MQKRGNGVRVIKLLFYIFSNLRLAYTFFWEQIVQ